MIKLEGPIGSDAIYTHDFSDASKWGSGVPGFGASACAIQPTPGLAYVLTGCEVKASTNVHIHSPLQVWFQQRRKSGQWGSIPPTSGNGPAYCVQYTSMKDWMKRGGGLPTVQKYPGNPELTQEIMLIPFHFTPQPVLWSSGGVDDRGWPRWNRMVLRIANHQPYRKLDETQIEMALAKYTVDIYREIVT